MAYPVQFSYRVTPLSQATTRISVDDNSDETVDPGSDGVQRRNGLHRLFIDYEGIFKNGNEVSFLKNKDKKQATKKEKNANQRRCEWWRMRSCEWSAVAVSVERPAVVDSQAVLRGWSPYE